MDMNLLSQSAQDIVKVTRGVGVYYLWIDALCMCKTPTKTKRVTYQQSIQSIEIAC
jgi:hypothetical protein